MYLTDFSNFTFIQGEVDSFQACVFSTEGALIVSGASTLCYKTKKKKDEDGDEDENGNGEGVKSKEDEQHRSSTVS